MIEDLVLNLARQNMASRENILTTELRKMGVLDALDPKNRHCGEIMVYPGGREVFVWHGVPLVEFFQTEMTQTQSPDGQVTIKIEQKYRLLYQTKVEKKSNPE